MKAAELNSFPSLFFRQVDRYQDRVALRHKDYGIWNRISWNEYGEQVRETAAGLLSLGVAPGRPDRDPGGQPPRMADLPSGRHDRRRGHLRRLPTSAPEQVAYVVGHSEAKVLFVENEEQVDKILQIIGELAINQVVVWDPKGLWGFSHEGIIFYDEYLENAKELSKEKPPNALMKGWSRSNRRTRP